MEQKHLVMLFSFYIDFSMLSPKYRAYYCFFILVDYLCRKKVNNFLSTHWEEITKLNGAVFNDLSINIQL